MAPRLAYSTGLLPIEHLSLARFVTDIDSPQRGYFDALPHESIDHTIVTQNNVLQCFQKETEAGFNSKLTEFLSLQKDKTQVQMSTVEAISSVAYHLRQRDVSFKKACELPATRRWLEDAIEDGKSVFFIVGFRTFINPSATDLVDDTANAGVGVQLPLSTVAAAQIPGAYLGNIIDPQVSWTNKGSANLFRRFGAKGELVYAVEFCRVKFKWYSSRKVEKSSLGPTKWKVFWGVRSATEAEEDDVIEAMLEDADTGDESGKEDNTGSEG